jgi:hypothetical protein
MAFKPFARPPVKTEEIQTKLPLAGLTPHLLKQQIPVSRVAAHDTGVTETCQSP